MPVGKILLGRLQRVVDRDEGREGRGVQRKEVKIFFNNFDHFRKSPFYVKLCSLPLL